MAYGGADDRGDVPTGAVPRGLFAGPSHATTVAAQHIVKDVMLVAAAMVIASTWAGARIAAHPGSIGSTLVTMAPRKVVASRGGAPGVPVHARRAGDYRSYAEGRG